MKIISVHIPTHQRPHDDTSFGHYLAGLIDGDGHFSTQQQLVISFHTLDASLAYYVKARLGYGSVRPVKDKQTHVLVLSSRAGVDAALTLINGKLRTKDRYNQVMNNILTPRVLTRGAVTPPFLINTDPCLANHWLAGFADANANFQIELIEQDSRREVRLNFQVNQKTEDVLLLIKGYLGGNIGYRSCQDNYYYGSTSFGSAQNVIQYFDTFHLLSSKHTNYLKWRKAYRFIQNGEHLTARGWDEITKLKSSMNRFAESSTI